MLNRPILVALIVAVAAASTALAITTSGRAGTAARNPSALILQKKDFPAGADYEPSTPDDLDLKHALGAKGLDVRTAGYLGTTFSDKKGQLLVHGAVIATSSIAVARRSFGIVVKARQDIWKTLGAPLQPTSGVPAYGDQQIALAKEPSVLHDGAIDLVVRKRSVVWLVEVVVKREPPAPMTEILADLKTYAAKQKAHIGNG
jgi:hypothetical protein